MSMVYAYWLSKIIKILMNYGLEVIIKEIND